MTDKTVRERIMTEAIAKAEADIKAAEIKAAVIESLPATPDFVYARDFWKTVAKVNYKAKTKVDAFQLFKQFETVPAFICRNGSTVSIKCFDDDQAGEAQEVFATVSIEQRQAELCFYAKTPAGIVDVNIQMPVHLFGAYRKSDVNARVHYRMVWDSLPKTREMYQAINYSSPYREGPDSGSNPVYALYDINEIENQFSGE